jgi:hypothetical protein
MVLTEYLRSRIAVTQNGFCYFITGCKIRPSSCINVAYKSLPYAFYALPLRSNFPFTLSNRTGPLHYS